MLFAIVERDLGEGQAGTGAVDAVEVAQDVSPKHAAQISPEPPAAKSRLPTRPPEFFGIVERVDSVELSVYFWCRKAH